MGLLKFAGLDYESEIGSVIEERQNPSLAGLENICTTGSVEARGWCENVNLRMVEEV